SRQSRSRETCPSSTSLIVTTRSCADPDTVTTLRNHAYGREDALARTGSHAEPETSAVSGGACPGGPGITRTSIKKRSPGQRVHEVDHDDLVVIQYAPSYFLGRGAGAAPPRSDPGGGRCRLGRAGACAAAAGHGSHGRRRDAGGDRLAAACTASEL